MGRLSRRPRQQQLLLDLVDRQLDEVLADLASERVASIARDAPVAFVDSHLVRWISAAAGWLKIYSSELHFGSATI
jgi:hypothetical protein